MPWPASCSIACAAPGFGGSVKARNPASVSPASQPAVAVGCRGLADGAVGDREQPHPVVPQLAGGLAGLRPPGAGEGLLAGGEPHGGAGVQDGGDGALGDYQAGPAPGSRRTLPRRRVKSKPTSPALPYWARATSRSSGWQASRIAASRVVRRPPVKTALSRA